MLHHTIKICNGFHIKNGNFVISNIILKFNVFSFFPGLFSTKCGKKDECFQPLAVGITVLTPVVSTYVLTTVLMSLNELKTTTLNSSIVTDDNAKIRWKIISKL